MEKTDQPKKKKLTRKKRKPRGKGKLYFTQVHEDAIVRFCITTSMKEKNELYENYIGPAFNEMVDKIVYTFKFTSLPNVDDLKDECKVWLTTILDKYDPNKGSKAFSYFSVITKHWFIHRVKKNSKQSKREVIIDDVRKEADFKVLSIENPYHELREGQEFWQNLWFEIDQWDDLDLKENEKKVLEAVKILLRNPDDIEIFNKKAIYLYLRELTGFNTKQVVNNLNKLRVKYRTFKKEWDDGSI